MKSRYLTLISAFALFFPACAALAQQSDPAPRLGPVTHLPLPRFVSLNSDEGNARRGPGLTHRIDWVFHHRGQPLEVVEEWGPWLLVRDQEGAGGWMHSSLLRGARMAVVSAEGGAALREDPAPDAPVAARAEPGAIGALLECAPRHCLFSRNGVEGWAAKADIWGARPDELF